jgi:carbamoyl-phosphate synthase small subunit
MNGLELASFVSTKKTYNIGHNSSKYKIAVIDFGIKTNILRCLESVGFYIKVFPMSTKIEHIMDWNPSGIFLSNGPGDPSSMHKTIIKVKKMIDSNIPVFGICLGHQVIAIANGVSTYKMFNGHRGINHPVINHNTGKGEITSQNHGFAIDRYAAESNPNIIISHSHLNDNTVAGIKIKSKNCFSVQYHPEAAPGPNDSNYLFDEFLELVKNFSS